MLFGELVWVEALEEEKKAAEASEGLAVARARCRAWGGRERCSVVEGDGSGDRKKEEGRAQGRGVGRVRVGAASGAIYASGGRIFMAHLLMAA